MADELRKAILKGMLDGFDDLQKTQVKLLARFDCSKKQAELLKSGIPNTPKPDSLEEKGKLIYVTWTTNGQEARATYEKLVMHLIEAGFRKFLALYWWDKQGKTNSFRFWIIEDGIFESIDYWRKKHLYARFDKAKDIKRVFENMAKEFHQKTKLSLSEKLFWAIRHNKLDKFKSLLRQGADIKFLHCGHVPFGYALYNGKLDFVRYMIEEQGLTLDKIRGKEIPLVAAISSGNVELVKYLIQQGANYKKKLYNGNTLMRTAVYGAIRREEERSEMIEYLMSLGMDINEESPAHNDAFRIYPLSKIIIAGTLGLARQCLELGADPNSPYDYENEDKTSPVLTYLCRAGQPKRVRLLLEFGVEINKKDSHGETSLDNMLNLKKLTDEKENDLINSFDRIGDMLDQLFSEDKKEIEKEKSLEERREECFELLLSAGAKTSKDFIKT